MIRTEIAKLDTYPFTVVENLSVDENDPFFIKKREEAIKVLTEAPLPDFLLERIEGPSVLKKNK